MCMLMPKKLGRLKNLTAKHIPIFISLNQFLLQYVFIGKLMYLELTLSNYSLYDVSSVISMVLVRL